MPRYRKKPIVVEAVQWTGHNPDELDAFCGAGGFIYLDEEDRGDGTAGTGSLFVAANNAWLAIPDGEWVIHDSAGFYPCKNEVFAVTYEAVEG